MWNIDHFVMNDLSLPLASAGRQTGFHLKFFFLFLKPHACHLNIKMFGMFTDPKVVVSPWKELPLILLANYGSFYVIPYKPILMVLQ